MRVESKTVCAILLLLAFHCPEIKAQTSKDTQLQDSAAALALRQYHAYVTPETGLFRGTEYVDYAHTIKTGHPYFIDSLIRGSIVYNGVFYPHVLLLYDVVQGLVVIKDPYEIWKMGLDREHVDSFTIAEHIFVRLKDSLNPTAPRNGYYEQLYKGRVVLLRKFVKTVQSQASFMSLGFERFTNESNSYYLRRGETYYPVNTEHSLLVALKDKSAQVKKFMRANRLRMKKDKQNTLVKVITWYDGPTQ
jgi:hypothetical protein